jgi:lipopolysaccharide/colanic/teichoic acid biosynthesis glycosyltransferase/glycosyltransferase involved in cell wall biosynthesis
VEPLHIAFFNRSYYPDTTATGQLLTELCESLVRDHGCRVSVVAGMPLLPAAKTAPVGGGLIMTRERHAGVDILRARGTRFPKTRFVGRATNYVSYFMSACWAGLRLERPDVVVALTDPPIIGVAGWLAARRFRAPFVMAYKDIFPEVARLLEDFQSEAVNRALQAVNCFLAGAADRNLALGETMRRRLIEGKGADPARTVVIPDWIDCEAVVPTARDNAFARENGLVGKFVVMHSGNIGLSQGLEVLVEAAALLRNVADLEVVFVGEGVKKSALQEQARALGAGNVRFLPFAPKERLSESFGAADAFVVSLKPGLAGYIVPSKLYGILAAGRPYVAAVENESEAAIITRQYDCGLVAESRKPRDVAERIIKLYEDRPLARRLGDNARRAALQFDRRPQVDAYRRVLAEVVGQAQAQRQAKTPIAKRALDVLLSGVGLLAATPLMMVIALAIKLDDRGPVFYGQPRVGRGGRRFTGWKFRSMIPESDRRFGPRQAGVADARITRVGHVLRATAMDELPQLWSIFRGDMSFVGPRALMPEEIEVSGTGVAVPIEKIEGYEMRQRVVPGLTGVAQIYADRDIPRRHKFRYDRLYIRKRSFWLDLRLIALSFWITFRGRWERRGEKLAS